MTKAAVHDFWNAASCGEALYLSHDDYRAQAEKRYELEPYIEGFADFASSKGQCVLEIGVGLGADHERFARAGANLTGIDLTERAIEHTRQRFDAASLASDLRVGDAECLPFSDATFDVVYSWGVLHHTPNTQIAINEACRVLKPDGEARIMIYHRYSLIGLMLWLRYGVFRKTLKAVYAEHLESPGTKAYSIADAKRMFRKFSSVTIATVITHGDLLTSDAGQRHRGRVLSIAKLIWPRWLFRTFFRGCGLHMLIRATK